MAIRFSVLGNGQQAEIIDTAEPTTAQSAATKNYVDTHSGVTGQITPERLQNFSEILPVADSDGYTSIFGVRNRHLGGNEDTEFIEADLLFRVRSNERQYFYGRTPAGLWREAVLYIPIDVENDHVYRMIAITENHHFHQMTATGNYVRGGTPGTGIDVDDTDTFRVTEWFDYDSELIINARIDSEFWATRAYVNANAGHSSFRGPWAAANSYASGEIVSYTFPATEATFPWLSDQTRLYQASSAIAANSARPPANTSFREVGTDQTVELSDMPTRSQQTGHNGSFLQLDTSGTEPRYVLTTNVATDSELRINTTFLQSQIDTNDTDIEVLRTYVDDHVLSVPVNKATGHHAPLQITGIRYNDAQIRWYVPPALATAASALATNLNALRGGDNSSAVRMSVQAWDGSDFQTARYEIICNQINYLGAVGNVDPYILFQGQQVTKNGVAAGINLQSDPEDGYFSDFSMYSNNNHVATIHTIQSVSVDSEYFAIPANGVLIYNDTDNTLHWQDLTTFIDSEAITQAELDTELRSQFSRLGLHYERDGTGDATLGVTYEFDQASAPVAGVAPVYNIHFNNASGGGRQSGDSENVTFTYPQLDGTLTVITTIVQDGFDGNNVPALLGSSIANNLVAHYTANNSAWPGVSIALNSQGNGIVITWAAAGVVNTGDITCGSSGVIGANPANPAPNLIYQRQIVTAGRANQPATYTIDNALSVDLPDWTSYIQTVQGYASDIDERARHEIYGLPVAGNTGAVGPLHIDSWSYNDTELVLRFDSEAAVGNQGLEALFQNFYDNGFNLPAGNTIGDLDIGFRVTWFDTDTNAFQTDSVFVYPHHGHQVIDTENHTITWTPVSGQAVFLQVNGSAPSATTVNNGRGYLNNLSFENADNTPYLSVITLPDTVGEQYYHYSSIPAGQVLLTTSAGVAGDTEWSLVDSSDFGATLYNRLRNEQIYTAVHYSNNPNIFPPRVDSEAQLQDQDIRLRNPNGTDTDHYYSHFTYGIYVNSDSDSEFQINTIDYYSGVYQLPTASGITIDHIPYHLPGDSELVHRPLRPNTGADSDTYPYLNGILYRGHRVNLVVGDLFIALDSQTNRRVWRCTAINAAGTAINVAQQTAVVTATFGRATDGTYESKTVTYP